MDKLNTPKGKGGMTNSIPELAPPTSTPTEWSEVERPLLMHLVRLGWQFMPGDIDVPELTERDNFRQVVLYERLRQAIKRLNDPDGPVDDLTVARAIRQPRAMLFLPLPCRFKTWIVCHSSIVITPLSPDAIFYIGLSLTGGSGFNENRGSSVYIFTKRGGMSAK
jgi:hypothetical protein